MTNFLKHDRNPCRWYFTLAKGIKSTKINIVYKHPIPQICRLICTVILYTVILKYLRVAVKDMGQEGVVTLLTLYLENMGGMGMVGLKIKHHKTQD